MTEIEVNRASHLIDPHLAIWGWEIPVYLFLGGMTAGIMILIPLIWQKLDQRALPPWVRWLPLAAPILLSIGMVALLLDLSYKWHFWRFYTAFKVTSPMSWGAWILVGIYPATLLQILAGLTDSEVDWLATRRFVNLAKLSKPLGWARRVALEHKSRIQMVNIALGIGLGTYTGLLLGTLGARHVWSSGVLGPLFLVSGFSTGAAFLMLFPLGRQAHRRLRRLDMGAIVVELGLLGAYLIGLATGSAAARAAAQLFLGGPYTATFWTLVVITGLGLPLVIETAESRQKLGPTVWAPVFLLIGGFSLRWILVGAGQV